MAVITPKWRGFWGRYFPEKRIFVRTDTETRYIRLPTYMQVLGVACMTVVTGWSIVAAAIVLMDTIGSGNFRDQARRDQQVYEQRLSDMAEERDMRAAEALAAQERFRTALAQVSSMQSQLLALEDRRKELERGIDVMQGTLRRTVKDRDTIADQLAALEAKQNGQNGGKPDSVRAQELADTLRYITATLDTTAEERNFTTEAAIEAQAQFAELDARFQDMELRTDQIFRQLEDAMTISVVPLDRMFRNAGVDTQRILSSVRRGYSGQGGALSPVRYPVAEQQAIPEDVQRANRILEQLDRLSVYSIAAQKLPFSMPVRGNYRFTSGFGPRWGRMHSGVDFAARHDSPIYATADGVVTRVGWVGTYGRVVYIRHEFGIETRYAHLSRIRVKRGQKVSRGQRIGDMGNTGRSTGTHLHYEVRVGGRAVNPMTYIKAARNVF